ncbi:MAG: YciI family protein [Acidobacteriota bacterium]|nr:YciI family protein [Acidobacteriota bacterium]
MAAVIIFVSGLFAADEKSPKDPSSFEMMTYVLGLLRKGPNWGAGTKEESARIQEGHMANIRKMAEAGKLIVAGPMGDDGDLRGIFIFKAKSPDEVHAMADEDPAIKSGRLVLEMHPWYAAAGLRVNDPKPAK